MKIVGKTHAKFVSTVSAWSELIGYVASIWLCVIKQRESLEREIELLQAAQRQRLVRRAPFRGFWWNVLCLCGGLAILGGMPNACWRESHSIIMHSSHSNPPPDQTTNRRASGMPRRTSILKRIWHSCTKPADSAPLACSKTCLVSRGPRVDDLGGAAACSCRGPVVCARVPESLTRSPPPPPPRFVPGAGRHPRQWQDAA